MERLADASMGALLHPLLFRVWTNPTQLLVLPLQLASVQTSLLLLLWACVIRLLLLLLLMRQQLLLCI